MVKLKQAGFGVVELLFIIVVVVVISVVGWVVYTNQIKTVSQDSQVTEDAKNAAPETTDPYEGWKEYCSVYGGYCFKYPTNWSTNVIADPIGEAGADSVRMVSPSGQVIVNYEPHLEGIGGACDVGNCFLKTIKIEELVGAPGLVLVQGVAERKGFDSTFDAYAIWGVMTADAVKEYGLVEGAKVDTGALFVLFQNPAASGTVQNFSIVDTVDFVTAEEVSAWFADGAEIQTAGQIFRSITAQDS